MDPINFLSRGTIRNLCSTIGHKAVTEKHMCLENLLVEHTSSAKKYPHRELFETLFIDSLDRSVLGVITGADEYKLEELSDIEDLRSKVATKIIEKLPKEGLLDVF